MNETQSTQFEAYTGALIKQTAEQVKTNELLTQIAKSLDRLPNELSDDICRLEKHFDDKVSFLEKSFETKIDEKVNMAVLKGKEKRSQSLQIAASLLVVLQILHDVFFVLFFLVIMDKMEVPEFLDFLKWVGAGAGAFGAQFVFKFFGEKMKNGNGK